MREIFKLHKDELIKLLEVNKGNISDTGKVFCKLHNLEYDDTKYRRCLSKFFEKEDLTNNKLRLEDTEQYKEATKRTLQKTSRYIITYEQNNTPLNKNFWSNILKYKNHINAELSVITGVYKNPNPKYSVLDDYYWNDETLTYRDANRHSIHKYITIASDVKLLPTAVHPLSTMSSLSDSESIILGHPKLSMTTEATLKKQARKYLFTTGAVTLPNYSDSKAGKKAESKHKFGFVIVEIKDDKTFFIRQVEADKEGNFYDLGNYVENEVVYNVNKVKGIVFGDIHGNHVDKELFKTMKEVCDKFNPNHIVFHDVVDGESVNNHIIKNPIEQYHRYKKGNHLIKKEIEQLKDLVRPFSKYNVIIPRANHNDRFDRYLISNDWKKDIANADEYLKYLSLNFQGRLQKGIIAYELEEAFDNIVCLDYDDSFEVGGYEVGQHGHIGANGSKGSNKAFWKLNRKCIKAHDHTLYREDDTFSVGTCTEMDLGYNKGMSSWGQGMAIIHQNNIAQLVAFHKTEYTI